ncbi:hypothetical protein BC831DRAFT_458040 [Entophlyctis helioformis]|nr:hypothetical protein BC831DRAFT_458040 [Entophlyctis helioformis]
MSIEPKYFGLLDGRWNLRTVKLERALADVADTADTPSSVPAAVPPWLPATAERGDAGGESRPKRSEMAELGEARAGSWVDSDSDSAGLVCGAGGWPLPLPLLPLPEKPLPEKSRPGVGMPPGECTAPPAVCGNMCGMGRLAGSDGGPLCDGDDERAAPSLGGVAGGGRDVRTGGDEAAALDCDASGWPCAVAAWAVAMGWPANEPAGAASAAFPG